MVSYKSQYTSELDCFGVAIRMRDLSQKLEIKKNLQVNFNTKLNTYAEFHYNI